MGRRRHECRRGTLKTCATGSAGRWRSGRDDNGLLVPLLKVVNLADFLLAEFLVGVEFLNELLVAPEFFAKPLVLILHGTDFVALIKGGGDTGRAAQVRGYAEGDQAERK